MKLAIDDRTDIEAALALHSRGVVLRDEIYSERPSKTAELKAREKSFDEHIAEAVSHLRKAQKIGKETAKDLRAALVQELSDDEADPTAGPSTARPTGPIRTDAPLLEDRQDPDMMAFLDGLAYSGH